MGTYENDDLERARNPDGGCPTSAMLDSAENNFFELKAVIEHENHSAPSEPCGDLRHFFKIVGACLTRLSSGQSLE